MPTLEEATQPVDTSKMTPAVASTQAPPAPDAQNAPAQNPFLRSPMPPTNASPDSLRQFYSGGLVPQFRAVPPPVTARKGTDGATGATGAAGKDGKDGKNGGTASRVTIPLIIPAPQSLSGFIPTLTSDGGADNNSSYALKIKGGVLTNTYPSATFTLEASSSQGLSIAAASVLKTLTGSTAVVGSAAVTFSGSSSATVPANGTLTTDAISMTFDTSHDYYFVIYVNGANLGIKYVAGSGGSPGPWQNVQPSSSTGPGSGDKTGVSDVSLFNFETGVAGTFWRIFSGASLSFSGGGGGGTLYTGTVPLGLTFTLIEVKVSKACRIRLYSSAAARDADESRDRETDPTRYTAHGLIFELIADTSYTFPLTWVCSPEASGSDAASFPVGSIAYTVEDLSGTSAALEIDFTVLQQETA